VQPYQQIYLPTSRTPQKRNIRSIIAFVNSIEPLSYQKTSKSNPKTFFAELALFDCYSLNEVERAERSMLWVISWLFSPMSCLYHFYAIGIPPIGLWKRSSQNPDHICRCLCVWCIGINGYWLALLMGPGSNFFYPCPIIFLLIGSGKVSHLRI